MHCENASAEPLDEPPEADLAAPVDAPAPATAGPPEPPPHPATSAPVLISPAAITAAFRSTRVGRPGGCLRFPNSSHMSFPLQLGESRCELACTTATVSGRYRGPRKRPPVGIVVFIGRHR